MIKANTMVRYLDLLPDVIRNGEADGNIYDDIVVARPAYLSSMRSFVMSRVKPSAVVHPVAAVTTATTSSAGSILTVSSPALK